jgi:predicted dehydrogenase
MKVGVIGYGKMGTDYVKKLIGLGIPAEDIVVWDIALERMMAAVSEHPSIVAAQSLDELARWADSFIVAVNTPAHHEVIDTLAQSGARNVLCESGTTSVLCEKPLAQNVIQLRKIRALSRQFSRMSIHTALVIQFSDVFDHISRLIRDEDLVFAGGNGVWGKNRGMTTERRPTAGDRTDECLWMIEVIMALIRHQGIRHATIHSAMCGYLDYANAESQRIAHKRDESFPHVPDHATSVNMSFATALESDIQVNLSSSFLLAQQRRNVGGVFKRRGTNEPVILIDLEFDMPEGDHLLVTRCRSNEKEHIVLKTDKLAVMTGAFLEHARSGIAHGSLASVEQAAVCIEILEAIGEADKLRREGIARFHQIAFGREEGSASFG